MIKSNITSTSTVILASCCFFSQHLAVIARTFNSANVFRVAAAGLILSRIHQIVTWLFDRDSKNQLFSCTKLYLQIFNGNLDSDTRKTQLKPVITISSNDFALKFN